MLANQVAKYNLQNKDYGYLAQMTGQMMMGMMTTLLLHL